MLDKNVPLCSDCKFLARGCKNKMAGYCRNPNQPATFSYVYGNTVVWQRAEQVRSDEQLCGHNAKWFEQFEEQHRYERF